MAPKNTEQVDDTEHEVLYISPGDCAGGHGRTYGWAKATNEDERADLIDQGYSPTLQEAYEAAGKPLKDRELAASLRAPKAPAKGAPKAPAKAAPAEDTDPITGDPITGDDGDPATPALADVQAALGRLKAAKDAKAVTKLLQQFKVTSATKLDDAKYAEVIAAADKAAKE